jgi:hypothetical protein
MTETTTQDAEIKPGDEITSRDDANRAVLNEGLALRYQPPAPNPTEYYYQHRAKGWVRQKCGHSLATSVDVDTVRATVDNGIAKNDAPGGGGIKAVEMERVEEYA